MAKPFSCLAGVVFLILLLVATLDVWITLSYGQTSCSPTAGDIEGPYYVPGAPVRSRIGSGLIIGGRVQGSQNCEALPGAKIEWWQVNPDGVYDDAHRATLLTAEDGGYSFETHSPVSYFRRPPHVHVKVFAEGYETLTTQIYPKVEEREIRFDFVLRMKK